MRVNFIHIIVFFGLGVLCGPIVHAQIELTAKGAQPQAQMSRDAMKVAQPFDAGTEKLPSALGGGEMQTHSLMISGTNQRGGKSFSPKELGVDNVLPGKWLDNQHYFFIGTDAVDIQDYFLYDSFNDKVYTCDFEVGEKLGYEEIPASKRLKVEAQGDILTGYTIQ